MNVDDILAILYETTEGFVQPASDEEDEGGDDA